MSALSDNDIFDIPTSFSSLELNGARLQYSSGSGPYFEVHLHRLGGFLSPSWQLRHVILYNWALLRFDDANSVARFSTERDSSAINGVLFLRDIDELRVCNAPVDADNNPFCIAVRSHGDLYEYLSFDDEETRTMVLNALAAGRSIISENRTTPMRMRAWFRRRRDMPWSRDPAAALALMRTQSHAMAVPEWAALVAAVSVPTAPMSRIESSLAGKMAEATAPTGQAPAAASPGPASTTLDDFIAAIDMMSRAEERSEAANAFFSAAAATALTPDQLARALQALPLRNERLAAARTLGRAYRQEGRERPTAELFAELRYEDERVYAFDAVDLVYAE